MVKFFCLRRNPCGRRVRDERWGRRPPPPADEESFDEESDHAVHDDSGVPAAVAAPPAVRCSIPRYGNLRRQFYDRLEALPTSALPVKPPKGQFIYSLNWSPSIVIKVDLRGEIILKHRNRRLCYKFASKEDIARVFGYAVELANVWNAHPPAAPPRGAVAEVLPIENGEEGA